MNDTANPKIKHRRTAAAFAELTTVLSLIAVAQMRAQTFTVLHSFTARPEVTNYDGSYPVGRLAANASGTVLYGTANTGGAGFGTVFAVNADGSGFTNLHSFIYTNGTQPLGGVILSGNRLYGTAWVGGPSGNGAVFALNTDGTGFTVLHRFSATVGSPPFATNSDGARSRAGLILSGSRLYGTTEYGGSGGNGTVFALNTDGTGFTNLHSFTAIGDQPPYPNSDGIRPRAGLILSGNTLFGTAVAGGSFARGTVFKVNTDGSDFTTLHSFTSADFHPVLNPLSGNSDGASPVAGLVLSGNTLYGTTENGGAFGQGVVFSLNTNGGDFTTLHSFYHATDGYYADATLIVSDNTLYGATIGSGGFGSGTVFALNTDGSGFTVLHRFINDSDGGEPDTLTLVGNSLYGVARSYGNFGNGTVFRLSFTPQLTINRSDADVTVTWPTTVAGFDYAGFVLQSATNLDASAVWSTNSLAPTVVNGQNTVSHPASEPQRFFRLKLP